MFCSPENPSFATVSMNRNFVAPALRGGPVRSVVSRPAMLRLLLFFWTCLIPGLAVSKTERPIHTYSALPGIEIQITADGGLQFVETDSGSPLLVGGLRAVPSSRLQRVGLGSGPFSRKAPEGISGGRRGELTRADDDRDGQIDEDPLDGLDNDGDGSVDEDFAAISDAMFVVDIDHGARHVEYYHWAYPQLTSAVFFTLSGERDPAGISDFRFDLPSGKWAEADVYSRRHSTGGHPNLDKCFARVARIPRPGGQGPDLWVGVMGLGPVSEIRTKPEIVADQGRLDIVHGGEAAVVACVAESWLQLNRLLCESGRVHQGVVDPVTGGRTPWVVPPLCSLCRQATNPEFLFSWAGDDDLLLRVAIDKGKNGLVDPDLFSLAGVALGSPVEIRWQPVNAEYGQVRWTSMSSALLQDPVPALSDPYAGFPSLLGHDATGSLVLHFTMPRSAMQILVPISGDEDLPKQIALEGRWLDGRVLKSLARREAGQSAGPRVVLNDDQKPETASAATLSDAQDRSEDSDSSSLSLATELLRGWPNPFREVIQVRFRIPQTVSEAFLWDKGHELPPGLDLRAPVPWENDIPFVTIKIYRINGQELITLHQDFQANGEMTVQWDGKDTYGRPVASGPYFCKLQMDDWSVTQRIIYLR
jgi:FlgD Ig-like domain